MKSGIIEKDYFSIEVDDNRALYYDTYHSTTNQEDHVLGGNRGMVGEEVLILWEHSVGGTTISTYTNISLSLTKLNAPKAYS